MKLPDHPESENYLRLQAEDRMMRAAFLMWENSNDLLPVDSYGLCWDVIQARRLVFELSAMLKTYNQALWEQGAACRLCMGRCCVASAASVEPFDLLALALLDLPFTEPAGSPHTKDCIFRGEEGCTWPDRWRTLGCWAHFCSGPPDIWANLPADSRQALEEATFWRLGEIISKGLPQELRRSHQVWNGRFDSPFAFTRRLNEALEAMLVKPMLARYAAAKISS